MTNLTCRHNKVSTRALVPLIGLVCLIGWVGASVAAAEHEGLHFQLGLDWKAASTTEKGGQLIVEYVRQGDDINNWKELFTYQNFARGKQTPEGFLNRLKAAREKECPGATSGM